MHMLSAWMGDLLGRGASKVEKNSEVRVLRVGHCRDGLPPSKKDARVRRTWLWLLKVGQYRDG